MNKADGLVIESDSEIQLIRRIAQGGMSVVYEALQRGTAGFSKRVAVKMMLTKYTDDQKFLELFVDEAKLVADLVHENIVQTHHLGLTEGSNFYIVMEFVEGISMHEFILHHRLNDIQIPEKLAVHIVSRIARGLSYAHQAVDRSGNPLNIVHRDICPSNIMISNEGITKITDFGVAKAKSNSLNTDKWLMGKVPYMSPEQAACRELNFRSDVYSLGAVLFELLSGRCLRSEDANPREDNFAEIPIPWDLLPKDTGKTLIGLLEKMLNPDPECRSVNTNDLAVALEYYIYKDGYGPTIQTVRDYILETFPNLDFKQPIDEMPASSLISPDAEVDT